jgi:predicted TIM-barrel fold metal-dependent hydrolase
MTLEVGSSWVAPLLKRLDKAARMAAAGPWLGGPLSDLPSEIFRRHIHVAPYVEDDIVDLVDAIGAERVLFGSDWPHPEGVAEPLDFLKELVALPDSQVRTIMRDNGVRLLGL